ncbi:Saccharopine dehydrogenase-domain-containing protein [Multifurca ochricompacta]|uniref:Saccharopine dehydrogenase-domain-containing protein n=1 Tax=Multifurca ochricompacta TaxID=376703 RepID=A0AAD4MA76_9AGAM|nr:Saccharopine dehydrogenase-domain-containing protein [Multifurca ochricompacta]
MSLRRVSCAVPPGRFSRRFYTSQAAPVTIGIRREDPERVWERRAPLTPDAVAELVRRDSVRVLVQECERRVFPVSEYLRAGAEVHSTLEPAHLILGIKEPPLSSLVTSPVRPINQNILVPRTHMMFSHTVKGQDYNMPLLSRFLAGGDYYADSKLVGKESIPQLRARLIDYELLTGTDGRRTVAFGWHAGVAGTLEALVAMAHKHLEHGVASPFLYAPRPHTSPYLDATSWANGLWCHRVSELALSGRLGLTKRISSNGNVTQGILSILSELPIVMVSTEELLALVNDPETDLRKIYVVHALPNSYLSRIDGSPYERPDYYANPHKYRSAFHTKIAPYLTLLLNGVGWNVGFPRLLTTSQLTLAKRLVAVGDISCDIGGGLQFVSRATTIDAPSYDVNGVTVVAVDILPASLPRDASVHFTEKLIRYVRSIVSDYKGKKGEDVEATGALKRAAIASEGRLQQGHEWLAEKVEAWRATQRSPTESTCTSVVSSEIEGRRSMIGRKKRVLVLGSGMVAGPAVDELAGRPDVELIVASNSLQEAERLVAAHSNASALLINIDDKTRVSQLVKESDIVISLLPAPLHPVVAELCIGHKKHMVTASYVSPAMRSLHSRAQSAGVLLLNEIGLDPGIDHCSAHSLLSRLRSENKKIVGFTSFCGGLPAPEAAEGVPLGYKFSWSPRGVLRAAGEGACFRLAGHGWEIPGERLLLQNFPDVPLSNGLRLEGLANRNSMHYTETYSLKEEDLRTMLRGTLRYPGFASLMHSFGIIGLLESSKPIFLEHWSSFARLALEQKFGLSISEGDIPSLKSAIACVLPPSRIAPLLEALTWLHLVPSTNVSAPPAPAFGSLVPVPRQALPPVDILALHLAHALRYMPHERDLVLLHHEIVARDSSGAEQVHTSTLTAYGDARTSAMARTVGLPVGFAALQVLDGSVSATGVCGPTVEDSVWKGVLRGLESKGLGVKESVKPGPSMEGVLAAGLQRRPL